MIKTDFMPLARRVERRADLGQHAARQGGVGDEVVDLARASDR